jgi:DNA (cytosine-5)-methyltransferase 1
MASVRELSYLQGFPEDYEFYADSVSNMYRHIGDSVPPMISYQYASLISSIIKGSTLAVDDLLMPRTFAEKIRITDRQQIGPTDRVNQLSMVAA